MVSRNKYANKPYPRPVPDHIARGYKPWAPNPNPGAIRTLTRARIEERRAARRIRSIKHLEAA